MRFSDFIPTEVKEQELTYKLISVLDRLQAYKESLVYDALRTTNNALIDNKTWLIKKLGAFGFERIPYELPLLVLQQLLLNVNKLNSLRGSYVGVELFVSIITMGEVTIDTSGWVKKSQQLIPNSLEQGYIVDDNSKPTFYIVDNNDILKQENKLPISVKSPYYGVMDLQIAAYEGVVSEYEGKKAGYPYIVSDEGWGIPEIGEYLIGDENNKGAILEYINFYSEAEITWNLSGRLTPYYHKLLNPYFV